MKFLHQKKLFDEYDLGSTIFGEPNVLSIQDMKIGIFKN